MGEGEGGERVKEGTVYTLVYMIQAMDDPKKKEVYTRVLLSLIHYFKIKITFNDITYVT